MWVFCKEGGVSIVRAPKSADRRLTEYGKRCFQVRGRELKTLDDVRRKYAPKSASKIETTHGRDYAYRFYVSESALGTMMAAMAMSIDYENFKDASKGPSYYHGLLMQIWSRWMDAAGTGIHSRFFSREYE